MMHPALTPGRIGSLALRNRFIKTATYEGMTPGGRVSEALVEHHASMAQNGVALTTVAYAAVCPDGRTFEEQLLVDHDNMPMLRKLTQAVHAQGGRASLQLGHCGGFSKNTAVSGGRPKGPSPAWNAYGLMYGLPRIAAMTPEDLEQVPRQFAQAATIARDCGFDAVEVHCGHGYLLSQFLSPAINRRQDAWGGSLENRCRLSVEVIGSVRAAVGSEFPILAKLNTSDDVKGGLTVPESLLVARLLEAAGADALVPSGGLVFQTPFYLMRGKIPLKAMIAAEKSWAQKAAIRMFSPMLIKHYPYQPGFFFDEASQMARQVQIPVALLGGVDSRAVVSRAMAAGFQFVAMGRALLADPDFIPRLAAGEDIVSRCTHCNACVGEMDRHGVRCILGDAPATPA
jgi:2,4-dienoyl-CoA reductase-like NADH-dependent reductase (Old Yellow Enzyme family)